MDNKYIDLLINNCLNLDKSLLIYYSIEVEDFVKKIVDRVKKLGVDDIYLDSYDINVIHDYLKEHDISDIEKSSLFDQSIWNDYAKKKANFLIIDTEYPHIMDDIDEIKIGISSNVKRDSRQIYRKMVEKCLLDWCIIAYPGKVWASDVFKEDGDSYNKLYNAIFKCCMLDRDNPSDSWNKFLDKQSKIINYLNGIDIKELVYSNSLGTDLHLFLPNNYLFSSAKDRNVIVNMPSYEVFTSPDYSRTKGIVYSSKPLMYNGGLVDSFWLEFDGGKVINYDAKVGREILKSIIESDDRSSYLGECAFVEKTSPIASMGIVFGTTLFDENASCHLALGAGFPECIKDGLDKDDKYLLDSGINISNNHVDFMIGTDDLSIKAILKDGREISIFDNGKYSDTLLENCYDEEVIN